ncbi:MAG: FtsX-like permease family protein [Candidatus Bathyarchaeia archaeon]|nr:ABC transporter permease [Candidatus Bathyarchaeota archaeon]
MFAWSLAIRNLRRRRLRTALTASGIVVGISMMFILLSLVSGMEAQTRSMIRALGGADITVSNSTSFRGGMGGGGPFGALPSPSTLDASIAEVISGIPGVYAVSPQFSFSGSISGRRITIYGIEPASYEIVTGGLNIVEGRFLAENSNGEIIVGNALMEFLNLTLGQTVSLSAGQGGKERTFNIIGVFETGMVFQEYAAYITLADAQDITGEYGVVTQILVKCEDPSIVSDVASLILSTVPGVRVTTPTAVIQQASQTLNTLTMFFATIGLVALFAGSFGVVNTMIMSVTERTREIGVLKAIGAKNHQIMKVFLAESLLIGLIGGGVGVAAGGILAYLFPMLTSGLFSVGASPFGMRNAGLSGRAISNIRLATPAITPTNIAICFSLGALVGILAGLYPAWRASRMKPVEALRHV